MRSLTMQKNINANILKRVKNAKTYKNGTIFLSYSFLSPTIKIMAVIKTATDATSENKAKTIKAFLTKIKTKKHNC